MLFIKLSFHIELVSFKNIDIWSINGPKSIKFGVYAKYGHMFLAYNSAIFCLIRITIHIRVPETTNINYYNIQIYLESATFLIKFLLFFGRSYFFFGLSYLIPTFFELSYFFSRKSAGHSA